MFIKNLYKTGNIFILLNLEEQTLQWQENCIINLR